MRLGLFGGRFDPVHFGHLLIAEQAREALSLDEIWFVPAHIPPHKHAAATAEQRWAMALLATADHPSFRVSRIELDREGPSYTYDTVQHVKRDRPEADVVLILGSDAASGLADWHRPHDLVRACTVVAFPRPGGGSVSQNLETALAEHVREIPGRLVDISGTDIRERVGDGRSIHYLAPPAVEAYIAKHGLYTGE